MPNDGIREVTCPVCIQFGMGNSRTYQNKWALALHIAYKAKMCSGGYQLHRKWVDNCCGKLNYKEYKITEFHKIAQEVYPVLKDLPERSRVDSETRTSERVKRMARELHQFIKKVLQKELGEDNDRWWYDGVPEDIREKCAQQMEKENGRKEKWDYLYLINLKAIVHDNPGLFQPSLKNQYSSTGQFENDIQKLNNIRNDLEHPTGKNLDIINLSGWLTDFEKRFNNITRTTK